MLRIQSKMQERQRAALQACTHLARKLGIECTRPRVLHDANNTVVHLAPAPVVAKVATTTIRPEAAASLEFEMSVATYLAPRGAPIAPPTSEPPPGPHDQSGFTITLWEFIASREEDSPQPADLADALGRFHRAFQGYRSDLPSFRSYVERAGSVLHQPTLLPTLSDEDRRFLMSVYERAVPFLDSLETPAQPLHGDPHLDGNILLSARGPLFVDLEAACSGPVEWDLTSLGQDVAKAYPGANVNLARSLSSVRSLCVSTWCWMQPGRSPGVDEAARFHLRLLHQRDGSLFS